MIFVLTWMVPFLKTQAILPFSFKWELLSEWFPPTAEKVDCASAAHTQIPDFDNRLGCLLHDNIFC